MIAMISVLQLKVPNQKVNESETVQLMCLRSLALHKKEKFIAYNDVIIRAYRAKFSQTLCALRKGILQRVLNYG